MSKNKTNGRGRPQKPKEDEQEISLDNNYIATNELALKLMEIFSQFATYRLLTITGPNSERNNDETKLRRKNVEKVQSKLREQLKIQEDYTFFLRDLDNCTLQYDITNDQLVDVNKYQLNKEEFKNLKIQDSVLKSIELVSNQLNPELQSFLNEFVKQYSQKYDQEDEFKKGFLNYILTNQHKYQEVINWNKLYDMAYNEKLELLKLQIVTFKGKYKVNDQNRTKKYKVDEKRESQLKQDQSQIEKIENYKGNHKSLELFINDIVDTLKQYWIQNDQEQET
ncbi:unnamed protein product (macronuclear) [Paramecium tetraurelia]|uniref:Uncharacterized protein n=1 Tax=Paramecium tetraurelia TaxID=5888 RepID=A0BVP8_PARTE|nr:uncharacterized protein GSPATT00032467001 [Paramecium tetraurelia]CAK62615.1 unnamed protein product [Paramecium tetraurelia]|eukprot:XP_001430013.1 hypothetical protein (macronuclear) [Paramecium tetraurelia strain d4-2]